MELVEGETLEERVRRTGPLDVRSVVEIARQIVDALSAAEKQGLVHRDLKPANVMIAASEVGERITVKVIDFGVAKALAETPDVRVLTHNGFIGTPAFASPEQFTNAPVDTRSDIYSLGATLWYLLTGHMPFGDRALDRSNNNRNSSTPPCEQLKAAHVPSRLSALLLSMLSIEPAARPGVRELTTRLEVIRAHLVDPKKTARRFALAAGLIALAAIVALFVFQPFGARVSPSKGSAAEKSVAVPLVNARSIAVPEKSIAVLPFENLSADQVRDEVLGMGMADTLITKLSNSSEIVVTSLTSVRKYGGLDQDPLAAGRALKVNSVLEGTVQRSGDHIRVTARLINVADGSSLWAGTFDEKFTDVFTVQDTISQKVADALALRLSGEEEKRLTKRYTENVEAYRLYLTGRYHVNKVTPPDITKSIGFFKQAIELDPSYALAYVGLADACRGLALTSDRPAKEVFPQAKAAATKAVQIDESLAESHAALASVLMWFDWDWVGAEREARRAISLNPNSGFSHLAYMLLLSNLGRHQEAMAEGARARELDPVSLLTNSGEGTALLFAGRKDEARERFQKTVELDPNFWIPHLWLGQLYLDEGKYPEALAEFSMAREFSRGNAEAISMIGYAWARAGDAVKARGVLDELKSLSAQRYIPASNIATVYLALGEEDEAVAWLEKAYEERDVHLGFLKIAPKWDSFRSDPRFVAILKRVGLH